MKIFITNDDGIHAEGLLALYRVLSNGNEVMVAAPDSERSAEGHGISLQRPLRKALHSSPDKQPWYAVAGTPADCVKLGLLALFEDRPDLVISGINAGVNDGINVLYSGTVAAAREASLYGIPAMAVSMTAGRPGYYETGAALARLLADRIDSLRIPPYTILNVNVPDLPLSEIAGIRFGGLDMTRPGDWVEKREDPRGREYFWYGYQKPAVTEKSGTDREVLNRNYVSITPLGCDMTDYHFLENLKQTNPERLFEELLATGRDSLS